MYETGIRKDGNQADSERELFVGMNRTFARAFVVTNLPTFLTYAIGTAVVSFLSPLAAALFAVYCVASTVAMWRFVCVNCPYYGAVCPCGYSTAASVLFKKGDPSILPQRFALIWFLVAPSWTVPMLTAIPKLAVDFSWLLLSFTIAFAVVAFLLAPSLTRVVGCCDYWRGCASPAGGGTPR